MSKKYKGFKGSGMNRNGKHATLSSHELNKLAQIIARVMALNLGIDTPYTDTPKRKGGQ